MRDCLVDPKLIAGTDVTPKRCASAAIHQPNYRVAVNGCRYRLAKPEVPKPGLFTRDGVQLLFLCAQIVEVEDQKVVVQAGAEIHQLRARAGALSGQQSEIFRAEAVD